MIDVILRVLASCREPYMAFTATKRTSVPCIPEVRMGFASGRTVVYLHQLCSNQEPGSLIWDCDQRAFWVIDESRLSQTREMFEMFRKDYADAGFSVIDELTDHDPPWNWS